MINKTSKIPMTPITKETLQTYLGKKDEYYAYFLTRYQLAPLFLSWNWVAFFFLPFWLAYRKLWRPLALMISLYLVVTLLSAHIISNRIIDAMFKSDLFDTLLLLATCVIILIISTGIALCANSLYLQQAEKYINALAKKQKLNRLQSKGRSIIALIIIFIFLGVLGSYLSLQQQTLSLAIEEKGISQLKEKLANYNNASNQGVDVLAVLLAPYDDLTVFDDIDLEKIQSRAIHRQDIAILQLLMDKKWDIKAKHFTKNDFFEWLYANKYWSIIAFLAKQHYFDSKTIALIKEINYKKKKPLQSAIEQGNVDTVRWMIAQKIPVPAKYYRKENESDNSPLILAVKENNPAMISLLLAHGANPNYKNSEGNSAAALAQRSNDNSVIALFADSLSKESFSIAALNTLIREGNIPLAKQIIDSGIDLNKKSAGSYPLEVAIGTDQGKDILVKYLIDKRANVNQIAEPTLLKMITDTQGTELMAYAIDHGARLDFKKSKNNLLDYAFNHERGLEKVIFLIEQGIPLTEVINSNNELPLHAAIRHKQKKIISFIIDEMIANDEQKFFNAQDKWGNTALHNAARFNDKATAARLIKQGADSLIKNKVNGFLQPIAYAHTESMLLLLKNDYSDDHSLNAGYCRAYVEKAADKSKQHHCLKSADYHLQKGNHTSTLFHYLLAGELDKVIKLGENSAWMAQSKNQYIYAESRAEVAHAYILKGNMKKSDEHYQQVDWFGTQISVEEKLITIEALYPGFSEKATALRDKR